MFDGLPGEEHHQFIASSRPASLPVHHLHGNPNPFSATPAFHDPYQELIPNIKTSQGDGGKHVHSNHLFPTTDNLVIPSSSDEVGALLKLRSGMDLVPFPADFSWEHFSRKPGEVGLKRSPEECRRKYAEEGKNATPSTSFCKSYKIFSDLDELYPDNLGMGMDQDQQLQNVEEEDGSKPTTRKKRRRKLEEEEEEEEKFEMLKGFMEGIVGKMLAQQEEMHNKLIADMVRRDEENVARELAWKRQETDRIQTAIELRAKQTASAGARQATMIKFLKSINSSDENPNYSSPSIISSSPPPPAAGKRWPRDEIVALINLRCKISNEEGGGANNNSKGPLWERISRGMVEMGYRRSAKRCKEKWENINKYFRKTRDSNKKRSVDSRTCPYFHHLTCLYTQGTLLPPTSTDH